MKFSLLTLLFVVTVSAALFAIFRLSPALAAFLVFVGIAILVRLIAGRMDGGRIREYIGRQGGELLVKKWAPFGTGWFDQSSARIYDIRYRDRDGNIRQATVKTSLFSGVYFTDDRVVYPGEGPDLDRTGSGSTATSSGISRTIKAGQPCLTCWSSRRAKQRSGHSGQASVERTPEYPCPIQPIANGLPVLKIFQSRNVC
jgi:hypothetical protein